MMDLRTADRRRFPLFPDAEVEVAVVDPGDVLYIPNVYWHEVISEGATMSISFWFRTSAYGVACVRVVFVAVPLRG
jgi:ribosomal protein L16 Arg81 hydroxylase